MTEHYPEMPGHRGIDTSIEAADSIADKTHIYHSRILNVIRTAGRYGATSDEVATALGMVNNYASRPRLSELRALKKIVDSKRRRINLSGRNAIVWVLPEHALEGADAAHG